MNASQELALKALQNSKGDDTYRAESAFRNLSPEQMQEQHGQSGQTRAEILAGYKTHDRAIEAAIDWVKSVVTC